MRYALPMLLTVLVVTLALTLAPPPAATAPPAARPLVAAFFPESPCVIGGKLHYVDYAAHTVMVWDGTNTVRLWHRDGTGPSGIVALADGTLLVTGNDDGTLTHLDATGKELAMIRDGDRPFSGPNDFVRDAAGGVYFSASGPWEKNGKDRPPQGKVYYRSAEGKVALVAQDIYYSNGLALIDGGERLLVAEGFQQRVLVYKVGKEGTLSERMVWKRLADIQPPPRDADWASGPDGLKVDSQGNVYICEFGASRILVTRPDGRWLRTIPVPLKGVTNLTFGPDEKSVIVTAVKDATEPYLGAVYEIPNP
jgi:gluconolactonase